MADQLFTFTLDSFRITDTRSRHNDTDYASLTLVVKSKDHKGTPRTLKKKIGDVNNGTHAVNLSFARIAVAPTDVVTMNYLIINSGHKSEGEIDKILETAGTKLVSLATTAAGAAAGAGVGAIVGSAIPGLGTILGSLAGLLGGEISGLLTADCDGVVAAEQNTFTYHDLIAKTAHGKFSHETKHPGTDSPHGCGKNSMYYVDWHIQEDK